MAENSAAVLHAVHDVRLEERAVPAPGPDEVLVEVRAVGVCGSDVHYYEHGRIGDFVVRSPLVLGHEAAGVVVGRGARASRHPLGARVAIEPGVPCGRCRQCRTGRYNLCPDVRFLATPPIDGAFVRYLAVHEDFAHPIPDSMSDAAGALVEPLAVGVWANLKAGTTIGSRVLVTGAGPIGVLCAQVARAAGAAHVTVVDVNAQRLAAARGFGADEVIDPTDGADLADVDADVLLECTGVEAVVRSGITALAPAGTAVLVGMGPTAEQAVPTALVQARELTVTGTFRYANIYPAAVQLAASGRVRMDELVGLSVPLRDAERALTTGRTDPSILKVVVVPSD